MELNDKLREGIAKIAEENWFKGDYPQVWLEIADKIILYFYSVLAEQTPAPLNKGKEMINDIPENNSRW